VNSSEAKQEFAVRHYNWGRSEFGTEIRNAFPILGCFKCGRFWTRCQFMKTLNEDEQIRLATAFLKKSNPEVLERLGEIVNQDENQLLNRFRVYSSSLETRRQEEVAIEARQRATDDKVARRSKIQKQMLRVLQEKFGSLGLEADSSEVCFKQNHGDWIINTHFDFNVRGRQFDYGHSIYSQSRVGQNGPPTAILGFPSLTGYLGLRGDTEFSEILEGDVGSVCDFVIRRSEVFLGIVPELLTGIEIAPSGR
jgi:hypothetical protein